MRNKFSLATLMLLVAIIAVGLTSVRTVFAKPADAAIAMFIGGFCGLLFAIGLALWNRNGMSRSLATVVGGIFLGIAAGAQMTAQVSWPFLFVTPILVVAIMWPIAGRLPRPRDRSMATQIQRITADS